MRRREQIVELEHALENERAENERIREELLRCTPAPVEPTEEWERRRAAWLPDEGVLPRGRKALRELVLTQRVEIAELVERVDDLTNELEGWRSADAGDVDTTEAGERIGYLEQARVMDAERLAGHRETIVDRELRIAYLDGELATARAELDSWRTGERGSELVGELERQVTRLELIGQEIRQALPDTYDGIPLAAAVTQLVGELRRSEATIATQREQLVTATGSRELELDRDGWRSRAQAALARIEELESQGAPRGLVPNETVDRLEARLRSIRGVLHRHEMTRTDDPGAIRCMYQELGAALDGELEANAPEAVLVWLCPDCGHVENFEGDTIPDVPPTYTCDSCADDPERGGEVPMRIATVQS